MAKKKLNRQNELALAIMDKCKELGCQGPNDTAELIGGATLILLNIIGGFLEVSFEDIRKEYVRGLLEAEIG